MARPRSFLVGPLEYINLAQSHAPPLALTRITLDHNGRLEEKLAVAWHPRWAQAFYHDLKGLIAALEVIATDSEFGP